MASLDALKRLNTRLEKLALAHPLARWNKTIAAASAAILVFVGQQYGTDTVSTVADIISVVSVFWVPNAPKE